LRLLKEGGDVGIRKFGDILQTLASLESDLALKEGASS
jgi:hypothetical protein